jgi:hypothetical protein
MYIILISIYKSGISIFYKAQVYSVKQCWDKVAKTLAKPGIQMQQHKQCHLKMLFILCYIIIYIIVYITTVEYQVCRVLWLTELTNISNYTHVYHTWMRLNSY